MLWRLVQFKKAAWPILIREFERVIEDKLVHQLNACCPTEVTESGNLILIKLVQLWNAKSFIPCNPVKYCSSSKEVMAVLPLNTLPKSVTEAASS